MLYFMAFHCPFEKKTGGRVSEMFKREVCKKRKLFSMICVVTLVFVQAIAIQGAIHEYLLWRKSGELGGLVMNFLAVLFLIISLSDLIADFSEKYRGFVDNIRYNRRKLCIIEMTAIFIFGMMTLISFITFSDEWLSFIIDDTPSGIIVTILFCIQFANLIIIKIL